MKNRTHVQHVRRLSLTEGTLCDVLGHRVVKMALCVGLWEGIYWADKFEETRETAHCTQKPFHYHYGESFTLKRDTKRHTERLHVVK